MLVDNRGETEEDQVIWYSTITHLCKASWNNLLDSEAGYNNEKKLKIDNLEEFKYSSSDPNLENGD